MRLRLFPVPSTSLMNGTRVGGARACSMPDGFSSFCFAHRCSLQNLSFAFLAEAAQWHDSACVSGLYISVIAHTWHGQTEFQRVFSSFRLAGSAAVVLAVPVSSAAVCSASSPRQSSFPRSAGGDDFARSSPSQDERVTPVCMAAQRG